MYYRCYLSTKIKAKDLDEREGILALEPDDYTEKELKTIKAKGYKIIGYLSVGTLEKERPWFKKFSKYKLKKLDDWPNEYFMDITAKPWRDFLIERARILRKRGFDGIWADNLDCYEEYKSEKNFAEWSGLLMSLHAECKYMMVNGGLEFWNDAMFRKAPIALMTNGVTQEEVFSRITNYSGKGKFGKQTGGYSKYYQSSLMNLRSRGMQTFLLEYTKNDGVKQDIKEFCKDYKMNGYHISGDVNL